MTKPIYIMINPRAHQGKAWKRWLKIRNQVLERIPGVSNADVSLENAQVTIQHDDAITGSDQLKQAIKDAGFEAV